MVCGWICFITQCWGEGIISWLGFRTTRAHFDESWENSLCCKLTTLMCQSHNKVVVIAAVFDKQYDTENCIFLSCFWNVMLNYPLLPKSYEWITCRMTCKAPVCNNYVSLAENLIPEVSKCKPNSQGSSYLICSGTSSRTENETSLNEA